MHKKYSARSLPSVYRDNSLVEQYSTNNISLLDDFVSNLEKNSVKPQRSIYDDITAIINNTKSKYSSVEEAVQDMKERTGLKALLSSASIDQPKIFDEIPEMKVFIDNFIEDHPGTSVESVVYDLLKIDSIRDKLPDRADVEDDVRVYINKELAKIRSDQSDLNKIDLHIGKVDQSSPEVGKDPFAICEPLKSQAMREVNIAVPVRIAKRLLALGRVAMGYPLQDGSWSIERGPFKDGERITLRFTTPSENKIFAEVKAIIVDKTALDDDGDQVGSFIATFAPIL